VITKEVYYIFTGIVFVFVSLTLSAPAPSPPSLLIANLNDIFAAAALLHQRGSDSRFIRMQTMKTPLKAQLFITNRLNQLEFTPASFPTFPTYFEINRWAHFQPNPNDLITFLNQRCRLIISSQFQSFLVDFCIMLNNSLSISSSFSVDH